MPGTMFAYDCHAKTEDSTHEARFRLDKLEHTILSMNLLDCRSGENLGFETHS